ncbi:lipopolysaccharide assembly protein LapA domain-containing protein [Nocardia sp. bgisy134]|uniref:lipopolysaccharide assembly protein LapA domain-containing protein n=1 Tax=unclassified Nocardia TaxID=2637762 RepID=UPI003D719006
MATEHRSFLARVSPTQWVALVLTVLAVLFVFDNRAKVTIEFLLISVESPMWLILLVMFVVGWITGVLMTRKRRR